MTEQEQAQVLARWLEQPAGTPPPDGLDPEVVESIYAMRPELAPAPSLTADDILADFDFGVAIAPEVGDESPGVVTLADGNTIPQTPVTAAPTSWRSANRIAGLGVLMATAATLLLVALPAIQTGDLAEPAMAPEAADVAAAPARSADPIASVADEAPAADAPASSGERARQEPAVIPVEELTLGVDGDAVADAGDLEGGEAYDKNMEFEPQQRARMTGEDSVIPEVEAQIQEQQAGYADDAVAVVDEDLEEEAAAYDYAPEPVAAAPAAPAEADYYGGKGAAVEEIQQESKKSRPSKRQSKKEAAEVSADTSTRDEARPVDYSPTAWRSSVDANTLADIDRALQIAQTEAGLGNYGKAADALTPYIVPPGPAGQFMAIQAAEYQLRAGNAAAAITLVQRGLGLDSTNSAYRSQLFYIYGLALDAGGQSDDAEVQWEEGSRLNRSRGR